MTNALNIYSHQLFIVNFKWEEGPRLRMFLKLFPVSAGGKSSHAFNASEVLRIRSIFIQWNMPENDFFGPYELLEFPLPDAYKDGKSQKLVIICYYVWWNFCR